jgi:hypothetical protein
MPAVAALGSVAALAAAGLASCGDPEKLSAEEGRALAGARERLDDALDTEEVLRTSAVEAHRLRGRVRRIVSDGSLEAATLDEFGIATLGQLREIVPSLVIIDAEDTARALDRRATDAFLRFAERDAARALLIPASRQVRSIVATVEEAGAGADTEIPVVRQTADAYVREAERDVRRIWPRLAQRLAEVRDGL